MWCVLGSFSIHNILGKFPLSKRQRTPQTAIASEMVLTNFECWAHGETADAVDFENGTGARHPAMADPFNRRVVSHIASASNGYYGYAIVNNDAAAAGVADNNNNNTCNNNNNNIVQAAAMEVNSIDAASARCKKRCFAMGGHNDHELDMEMDNLTAVKRCRFDDADLMAQYCNGNYAHKLTKTYLMCNLFFCVVGLDFFTPLPLPHAKQQQQRQNVYLFNCR